MQVIELLQPRKLTPIRRWYTLVDDFETSTPEFYQAIEAELRKREIPNLEVTYLEFPEGGALSARRLYLRMRRERLVFDVCSSSFGTSWFFSCRFSEVPLKVRIWHLLVIAGVLFGLYGIHTAVFGLAWGIAAFVLNVLGLAFLLSSVVPLGYYDLDAVILRVPILGPFYERFLRRETYFREDTRDMYCDTVDKVVQATVVETSGVEDATKIEFKHESLSTGQVFWGHICDSIGSLWSGLTKG